MRPAESRKLRRHLQGDRHGVEFPVRSLVLARALDVAERRRVGERIAPVAARRGRDRELAPTTPESLTPTTTISR